MNDTPPYTHGPSAAGVFGWLVLLAAMAAGMWKLYEELQFVRASVPPAGIAEALQAQGAAIEGLKAQLAQGTPAVPADVNAPAWQNIEAQLAILSQRLDTLQVNKPVAPPNAGPVRLYLTLANKVYRGMPYADELETLATLPELAGAADAVNALRTYAAQGLPGDLALREGFNAVLDTNAPTGSAVTDAVNARLGGLITVKRRVSAPGEQSALRDLPLDTPIAVLAEKVNTLPEDARVPFNDWLHTVAARTQAEQALATIQNLLLPLQ